MWRYFIVSCLKFHNFVIIGCFQVHNSVIIGCFQVCLLLPVLFALVHHACGMIHNMAIPQGLDDCFTRYAQKTSITHTVGQSINWICVHQYMWQQNGMHKWFNYNVTSHANVWYSRLLVFPNRRRLTNTGPVKVRKEIRMMSDLERHKFFRAIQMLKADKVWSLQIINWYIFRVTLFHNKATLTCR